MLPVVPQIKASAALVLQRAEIYRLATNLTVRVIAHDTRTTRPPPTIAKSSARMALLANAAAPTLLAKVAGVLVQWHRLPLTFGFA